MKKSSSKCGKGGKVSSKKSAPTKKMADGGKPDRSIFGLTGKRKVKTKYGSVTGQGRTTTLEKSKPTVKTTIKVSDKPKRTANSRTTYKNVRYL